MSEVKKKQACTKKKYIVHTKDLPLSCPPDGTEVWNAHPKVYLPIEETGTEICPYCGAKYVLKHD